MTPARGLVCAGVLLVTMIECSSPAPTPRPGAGSEGSSNHAPLTIERRLPDAAWERAADVALQMLQPWLATEKSFTRLVLEPVRAPDGSTIEYLIRYEAFRGDVSEFKSRVLVVGGKAIVLDGAAAATPYLRSLEFPTKQLDRGLLFEILESYGITRGWILAPSLDGWPAADQLELVYVAAGATLTMYRGSQDFRLKHRALRDRLVIHFARDAAITITSDHEQPDGTWTPITPEP